MCESIVLDHDTKQCKVILQTIRTLEYIIKTYFNSKYVEYPDKQFNPQQYNINKHKINRDLSLMVKYETFNLCYMGSNPIGLNLLHLIRYSYYI